MLNKGFRMLLLLSLLLLCAYGGAAQEDKVGGTFVVSLAVETDTLDIQLSSGGADAIMSLVGASLITRDPETGEYIPYLAESWDVSEDGLTLTFTLKEGIMFHDGTPLTAQDYAWTFNRALDPATASPSTGPLLAGVTNVEATDDRTLVFHLEQPNFAILNSLSLSGYTMPYPQAYFEANGADHFARNPVSVGPFIFKEWVVGEYIRVERNPDFNWGPAYAPGPWNFGAVEFRFILDQATDLAALEAGEIMVTGVPQTELARFMDSEQFTIYNSMDQILFPALTFNLARPPFDDIRIRQAINYAVNREGIIAVFLQGNGEPAYGPLPPSIPGYWPGVEEIGYRYDPDKARALFEEAGWTMGDSGFLEKDGETLSFTLLALPYDFVIPAMEILKEQFREIGIDMTIEQSDPSILYEKAALGDYDVMTNGYSYPEADVLYLFFHSSNMGGGLNYGQLADPALDAMLEATRTTMDPAARQEVVNQVQQYIVEQAYWVPIYNAYGNTVLSNNVRDAFWSDALNGLVYNNAYLENR